jgi:hypothetical protein
MFRERKIALDASNPLTTSTESICWLSWWLCVDEFDLTFGFICIDPIIDVSDGFPVADVWMVFHVRGGID